MGAVLDLTARAVSFLSLMQDIVSANNYYLPQGENCKVAILDTPSPIILQKIKDANTGNKVFQQRTVELIWVSRKAPDLPEVQKEFYRRSQMLLAWIQGRSKQIRENLHRSRAITDAEKAGNTYSQANHFFTPSLHQWREAIRAYLYDNPEARVSLAKALDYLPLLVVLALGGGRFNKIEQRLLQEWFTSEEITDRLLTKKELSLLNRWRLSGTDRKAEKLLVNEMLLLRKLRAREIPVPFELIFHEELREVSASRQRRNQETGTDSLPDPLRRAEAMQLRGLCLSGGGIRSATFNLGLLQGLAKHGYLQKIDYLSTVSGGGYIGSWLVSWIKRTGSLAKVSARINPDISKDPRGDEVHPLRWLRMYSNYLTPASSIMSTDSWTLGITWLRNTLLNQLIILLLLCTLLLLGIGLLYCWKQLTWEDAGQQTVLSYSSLLLAPGALLAGWGMHSFNSQHSRPNPFKPEYAKFITNTLLFFSLFAAFHVSGWLYPDKSSEWFIPCNFLERIQILAPAGFTGWIALLLVAILGRYHVCYPSHKTHFKRIRTGLNWGAMIFFSAIAAALGVVLLALAWKVLTLIPQMREWKAVQQLVPGRTLVYLNRVGFILGVPLILEVISLTVVTRMALMGTLFPDERREWWGRLGARLHRLALIWVVIAGAVLLGVIFVRLLFNNVENGTSLLSGASVSVTATGWLALVAAGVKLAFSSKTSGETQSATKLELVRDTFVRIAPYLFGFGFLLIAANIIQWLLSHPWYIFPSDTTSEYPWKWLWSLFSGFVVCTVILIWRVGVNEFSMHHFYRNRLVRAYLGASRRGTDRERSSNAFTGFDPRDDLKLATLTCFKEYGGPYPIVNATLNATYRGDLDRQDRKAESFIFSPLYCGYDMAKTSASANIAGQTYDYGYRPTKQYGYEQGPSIGTAMAISGAATSPNMGYHSSSATAFLLTAFNVRLGWWMGNPRRNTWKQSDPSFGLAYVINDLFGRTSTHDQFVCLSDGGHFDNMGLYELIRRRCSLVILGDAEQDRLFTCQGLANAIRRCRIDFGVEIKIDISPITNREPFTKQSSQHYALGSIRYPGDPPSAPSGVILYIKTSLTGDEPVDLREYALANPKYPHQSTGNQFFDESQFESYRRLGLHILEEVLLAPPVRQALNVH